MAEHFTDTEVIQRIRAGLAFAFADAYIDDEVSVEDYEDDESDTITLVQYSLETNEPVARFKVRFSMESSGDT